jgi:propionyl-CoA carboxylase alpha chain
MKRLLVANRGEIARRIIRSARRLGLECVAVFSDPDANSPHVAEADLAVRLPGATAAETYLSVPAILEAARRTGADALHPGYGFLAEDARFVAACEDAGLCFVGPPASAVEAMGSKLAAKRLMAEAGVPVLPTLELGAPRAEPPDARAQRISEELGWPVLVKASAGGGGRGMRVVERFEELEVALEAAEREAAAAFGDPTVFLEPYVAKPRHVEVQVLGDRRGTVVHLFERECSIQRRHQKIVEESPSPGIDDAQREELTAAAVRAAKAVGYSNAGTVEFLVAPDGRFAFLEMNTRLQVEHPVTEAVTGLDLVALQLLVADGQHLPDEALEPPRRGHAVEARLYAEDPLLDWAPSTGDIARFAVPHDVEFTWQGAPSDGAVRLDAGVATGTQVSPFYDPLLAKVVAWAPRREQAVRLLAHALRRAELHGPTTNRDLLVAVLLHEEFLEGTTDTAFLERHDPRELGRVPLDEEGLRRHAAAAALAAQARARRDAPVLAGLPSGWRNLFSEPQRRRFRVRLRSDEERVLEVAYRFDRRNRLTWLAVDDVVLEGLDALEIAPERVVLEQEGLRRELRVHSSDAMCWVDGEDGSSALVELPRFVEPGAKEEPGSLLAPLPGTVVKVFAHAGERVARGQVLIVIEAMKMEHEVRSPLAGTLVALGVSEGDQVEAGTPIGQVEEAS